ncbi:MAG: hypothetical protein IPM47_00665 [Sphingobacteriales bacterium]|nr:MAG: hypothetical protein IPM47_00665 [Sphingobacteriales bacterium]
MKPILYFLLLFSFIGNIDLFSQTGTFETSIDPDVGQGSNNGVGIRATTDGLIICSASSCTAGIPCLDIVKTDWTGNILWIRRIEDPSDILRFFKESCVINTDGSFNAMIAKTVDENRQFFLYTFDSLGNEIWNREYGTENKESGFGGIIQVENDHLLAYCSTGTDWVYAKTMLTKINKQGDVLWQKYMPQI